MKKIFTGIVVPILVFIALGNFVNAEESLLQNASKTVDALILFRNSINNRYQSYLNTQGRISELEDKLAPIELEINTLREQIKNFDENIRRAEINLSAAEQYTKAVQLELIDLYEDSDALEIDLAHSRRLLDDFMRLAYQDMMQYTDWETGEISSLKFLLTDKSLADLETQQTYLNVLQNTSAALIEDLQNKQKKYSENETELLQKKGELIIRQQELIDQRKNLKEMRESKARLLKETRGQESEYKKLVEENRKQQMEVLLEIEDMKEQLSVIDGKLIGLKDQLGEETFRDLLKDQSVGDLHGLTFPGRVPRLAWPANPARGITAYFLDEEYEQIFNMPHRAIDFRLYQGSKVFAAAPGIVYKTKNNGYGYSYIMLAHADGLVTVYGHISKILVKEGDAVQAGTTIGLSGGAPGTPGAGYMTTGPHLHFEVIDNGEHKNPLDYLPLEQLPLDSIPEKYLQEAKKT